MKTAMIVLAVIVLLAPAAQAQRAYCGLPNTIGLYTTPTPTGGNDLCVVQSSPGAASFQLYLLICNPTDETTGLPITNLGGYELGVFPTEGWFLEFTYPANTILFSQGPPNIRIAGLIPITGDFTVLAEVTLRSWDGTMGAIYMNQIDDGSPTIPGHMAITNADNEFIPSRAYPVLAEDLDDGSVFFINWGGCMPLPAAESSWGAVKAMYR
ncbi:MAG: hypothetical protein GY838_14255 [bacterium]|nr:hypothetical protein [bacterium]